VIEVMAALTVPGSEQAARQARARV
jgi:hypothetical protein